MKKWLGTRSVRLRFGVALLLSSALSVLSAGGTIDGTLASSIISFLGRIPFKDVLVNAVGGFLGGLALLWAAVGSRGVRSLRTKLSRPTVRLVRDKAPVNIFTGLELGAPRQWIQQELGAPTRVGRNWWGYRFSDALVSLTFNDDESLQCVAVALTDAGATFDFPAWHFDMPPLGKATLKDLISADHLEMHFRDSTRHSEVLVTGREGPRGAWHYIALGALSPHIPGPLLSSDFEWNREKDLLASRPETVLINWAAISSVSNFDTFPWDLGISQ